MTRKIRHYRMGTRNGGPFSLAGFLMLGVIGFASWVLDKYWHVPVYEAVPGVVVVLVTIWGATKLRG